MKHFKAGIIGFGGMGQRHYKAYCSAGVEVAAVCDWDTKKVNKFLPEFPSKNVYADYRRLLKEHTLDIISVVSNGPTHAEVAIAAAKSGVPRILLEKPVATNLVDADMVIRTCKHYGVRLAVNHIRRFSPTYKQLKNAINKGLIGRLRHIYFQCGSTGLGNFVVHAFDTMRYLLDSEVDWAIGVLDKTGTPNPRGRQFIDPAGYGILHFKNGARGFVDSSEDTGVQYQYVFVGEYGRVVVDELNDRWEIRTRHKNLRGQPFTRYGTPMIQAAFKNTTHFDIVDLTRRAVINLLSVKPVICAGQDGFKALELVTAFHLSDQKNGRKILLPLKKSCWRKDIPIA